MLIVFFSSGKYKGLQHAFINQEADSNASIQGERNAELFSPLFSALHQFHTLLVLLTSMESLLTYSAIKKTGMMPLKYAEMFSAYTMYSRDLQRHLSTW